MNYYLIFNLLLFVLCNSDLSIWIFMCFSLRNFLWHTTHIQNVDDFFVTFSSKGISNWLISCVIFSLLCCSFSHFFNSTFIFYASVKGLLSLSLIWIISFFGSSIFSNSIRLIITKWINYLLQALILHSPYKKNKTNLSSGFG